MKKSVSIAIVVFLIAGITYLVFDKYILVAESKENLAKNKNLNLTSVSADYEVDLSNLDSVRNNLNGFWISENQIEQEYILWLNFHESTNRTIWQSIPYNEETKQTESLTLETCSTYASLIKLNGKIHLEFISLVGSDTIEIKSFTKTKFTMNGTTYLRHEGYDFLKNGKFNG